MSEQTTMKVLFVSPECTPFANTGGLGEVASSLPKALCRRGIDCRVILPLYGMVKQEYRDKMLFLGTGIVPVGWRQQYIGLFQLEWEGVIYYFIDNEYYFKREGGLYGFYDDGERFAYFSRAVFEAMEIAGFHPHIIHANDWQSALVPVYQTALYRKDFVKTVYTIHNIEYQGYFGTDIFDSIIDLSPDDRHLVEFQTGVNLMKGAIETANAVTTVSPSYAEELKDPANAFGLDAIVRRNAYKISGIINGIDTEVYDPETDPFIAGHFSKDDMSGKDDCKRDLQRSMALPEKDVPLITMITRLVAPKGLDLVRATMDSILAENDVQFIMLGTGDAEYENYFRGLEYRCPDKVRSCIQFSGALSHRIYAGGNILLVPSRSEPCGLTQMIGCRYANAPLVRKTGGLGDTIEDCTHGSGNGFVFDEFTPDAFRTALQKAIDLYQDRKSWEALERFDMEQDFTWNHPAEDYIRLYKSL